MNFENNFLNGIFGPNMSDLPNWSLTANSRSLQAAVLKTLSSHSWQNTNHVPACLSAAAFGFRLTCIHSKEAGFFFIPSKETSQYEAILRCTFVEHSENPLNF